MFLIRADRRQTSTALRLVETAARVGSIACVLLALVVAFVVYRQVEAGAETFKRRPLGYVVVAGFSLGALLMHALGRLARRLRLNPSWRPPKPPVR
jgi:hypothetical protein